MIDEERAKNPPKTPKKGQNVEEGSSGASFLWSKMPVEERIRHFDELLAHLPMLKLSEFDVEKELMLQYHRTSFLQSAVLADEEVPANQKAQVANSVSSTLSKIADLQLKMYSSERFKEIEALLIQSLGGLPEDKAEEFLKKYEQVLRKYDA